MCVIISVSPSKTLLVTAHTASVMKLSVLTHQITHRRGSTNSTERYFCDFLVNGHSLLEMLDKLSGSKDGQPSDLIGSFVVGYPEHNQQKRDQLLLATQPDIPSPGASCSIFAPNAAIWDVARTPCGLKKPVTITRGMILHTKTATSRHT